MVSPTLYNFYDQDNVYQFPLQSCLHPSRFKLGAGRFAINSNDTNPSYKFVKEYKNIFVKFKYESNSKSIKATYLLREETHEFISKLMQLTRKCKEKKDDLYISTVRPMLKAEYIQDGKSSRGMPEGGDKIVKPILI